MIAVGFAERANLFARQVVAGDVVAGKWEKAACQRHLDDLDRSDADAEWPYCFDADRAQRVCEFKELLPHIKGDSAKPIYVDGQATFPKIVLEDWQIFINAVKFGWVHRITRRRRFRRSYVEVGRKNAKSTDAAGTGLYMLAADDEQGPEVYTAATKKDQARIVWMVAQQMVRREPEFKALGIGFTKVQLYNALTAGIFAPLARDYGSLDGLNTSCFISDELHAQRDRRLYDVLDSSTGARTQPLGDAITTAGTDRAGVCYAQRTYVTKLLNTVLHAHEGMGYKIKGGRAEDDTYFGIIFTIDTDYADGRPDDEWGDEAFWPKANPMLRAVHNKEYAQILLDDLRASVKKALTMPSEQAEFRTKRCNQWLGADTAWMDMHAWSKCGRPGLTEEMFSGEECVASLDAAFKTDVFAKIKLFERDGVYTAFGKYFVPQRMVEAKGNDHIAGWVAEGLIDVSDGAVVDVEAVKESLRHDATLHRVREVPFDPYQLTQFAAEMIEEGFEMVELRPSVQTFSEPMKRLMELVLTGHFEHNGDPVLEWMISNVVCHSDRKDNIYPNKDKPENKIDGAIALLMCLNRMAVPAGDEAPEEVSVA